MGPFDHVLVLLSFVYALAVTHLLSRIGALLVARKRVRFSGLLALGMINAIALVYSNWLQLWDLRGMRDWDLLSTTIQFVFAVAMYFLCIFVGPESENDEGDIDMEALYWRQRRPFYYMLLAALVLSLFANAEFLKTPNANLFVSENLGTLPMFVPIAIALATKARWAQWAGGGLLLAMVIGFTVVFAQRLA